MKTKLDEDMYRVGSLAAGAYKSMKYGLQERAMAVGFDGIDPDHLRESLKEIDRDMAEAREILRKYIA